MNGKTATCLAALEPRHLPALVIAPKRVAEHVWPTEGRLWRPDLEVALAAGDPGERLAHLQRETDIVSLGVDNIQDLAKVRRKTEFRTVIFDELSLYKNQTSKRWKMARKLANAPDVSHVWGLTGTPVPNGYLNLWPQIAILDNGARLGRNITTYRSRYFLATNQLPNGVVTEWTLRPEAEGHIKDLIEDLCLSMTSQGRITLPPLTFNTVEVELPAAVRREYKRLKDDLVIDLRELFDGNIHSAATAGALTSRLSQMTAGFIYEDPTYTEDADGEFVQDNVGAHTILHDAKIRACREIIDGTGGSPVLVFYRFQAERAMLEAALDGARGIQEPGVLGAWDRGEVPVLLAHPASAGHGLNLQHGGHTQIWTSPTWDLEHWEQGYTRSYRQGQRHPVVIHTLAAKNTIDHLIIARNAGKADVQDSLLAHLESPI